MWWGVLALVMLVVGIGLIVWWALDTRSKEKPDSETVFLPDEQIRQIDQRYRA